MNVPSVSRIFKWLILIGLYFWVSSLCVGTFLLPLSLSFAYRDDTFSNLLSGLLSTLSCVAPIGVFGLLMGLMVYIFNTDRKREVDASDDFKKNRLFIRYGYEFNKISIPVPVKADWEDKDIAALVDELRTKLANQFKTRYAADKVEVLNPVYVKDKDLPSDSRAFLRITYNSRRGSRISHFIHYAIAGKYVVIHYTSRVRGNYRWHDIVDFVISGPMTIWGWGLDWIQNQFSVISYISRFVTNSYDEIDLKTFFDSSYYVMLDETRDFLDEKGLLTKELEQVIINNINNSQNINVTGSSGVSVGRVINAVQGATQNIGRASK